MSDNDNPTVKRTTPEAVIALLATYALDTNGLRALGAMVAHAENGATEAEARGGSWAAREDAKTSAALARALGDAIARYTQPKTAAKFDLGAALAPNEAKAKAK